MKEEYVGVTTKNFEPGKKVKPGPGWIYADQHQGCEYGLLVNIDNYDYDWRSPPSRWCQVDWIDEDGNVCNNNNYELDGKVLVYYRDIDTLLEELDKLEDKLK